MKIYGIVFATVGALAMLSACASYGYRDGYYGEGSYGNSYYGSGDYGTAGGSDRYGYRDRYGRQPQNGRYRYDDGDRRY